VERDSYPSPLNYNAFPKSVCTSVNEVICHVSHKEEERYTGLTEQGIPDQRPLGKSRAHGHRVG
jgi:methionine aminopeptidase